MSIQPPRSGLGFSARLEAELARIANGIRPAEWEAMDGDRQAYYVAVYQHKHQMEAVVAHDQAEQAKRANRPKRGKYG